MKIHYRVTPIVIWGICRSKLTIESYSFFSIEADYPFIVDTKISPLGQIPCFEINGFYHVIANGGHQHAKDIILRSCVLQKTILINKQSLKKKKKNDWESLSENEWKDFEGYCFHNLSEVL